MIRDKSEVINNHLWYVNPEVILDAVTYVLHAIRESDALAIEAKTRLDIVDDIFTMVMKTRDLKEIDVLEKVQKVVLEGLGVTQK